MRRGGKCREEKGGIGEGMKVMRGEGGTGAMISQSLNKWLNSEINHVA